MIERLLSPAEVADLLGESERYVREKCRRQEWPHRRGSRGTPRFSVDDVAEIRDLIAVPVATAASPRISFAPRSRRSA